MASNVQQAAEQVAKRTKYDEMTGGVPDAPEVEAEEWIPRVIYTQDAQADLTKMKIPILRLAQGMTEEVKQRKAMPGQYVLTNFPAVDEVIFIPMAGQYIRIYKPDPKKRPKCQAPYGTKGYGIPGIICADCALSKWQGKDPRTGNSKKPPCNEGVSIRGYSVNHRCLVDYQFMTGAMPTGQFIQQQAMAFHWNQFSVRMQSRTVENSLGSWYVPELEMMTDFPEEHREIATKWYEALQESMAKTLEEAALELEAGLEILNAIGPIIDVDD